MCRWTPGPVRVTVMRRGKLLSIIYRVNFSLLTAHEIDSAFWREWELFRLPGGSQFFVLLHIPLLLIALLGLQQLLLGRRSGCWISLFLGGSGLGGVVVHTIFLLQGHREFLLPASLFVLAAVLFVSLVQRPPVFRWAPRDSALRSSVALDRSHHRLPPNGQSLPPASQPLINADTLSPGIVPDLRNLLVSRRQ